MVNLPFIYSLKTNPRAKNLSVRITREGEVKVTKPSRVSITIVEFFIERKKEWIMEKVKLMKSLPFVPKKITRVEYLKLKEKAFILAQERVQYFNTYYNFTYKRISIKNQKTRWGSCSSQGNLNFSYKIALLPSELRDYIIVHELCHLGQMNHGSAFWNLVAKTIPEYKKHHKTLRNKGLELS